MTNMEWTVFGVLVAVVGFFVRHFYTSLTSHVDICNASNILKAASSAAMDQHLSDLQATCNMQFANIERAIGQLRDEIREERYRKG